MENLLIAFAFLILSALGALIAKSRNRTTWKGAILGLLPITLVLMILFLKPKGERSRKSKLTDRIITSFILILVGSIFVLRIIIDYQLNNTTNQRTQLFTKVNFLRDLNEGAPSTISFSGSQETLFLTLSLKEEAKQSNTSYSILEKKFDDTILTCTKIYYKWYESNSPTFLLSAKNNGYLFFQVKVKYKDGVIKDSRIMTL